MARRCGSCESIKQVVCLMNQYQYQFVVYAEYYWFTNEFNMDGMDGISFHMLYQKNIIIFNKIKEKILKIGKDYFVALNTKLIISVIKSNNTNLFLWYMVPSFNW